MKKPVVIISDRKQWDAAIRVLDSHGLQWHQTPAYKDLCEEVGICLDRGKLRSDCYSCFSINPHIYEFVNLEALIRRGEMKADKHRKAADKHRLIQNGTDRIVQVMFSDHGSFGWNADTKNPVAIELFATKKLTLPEKILAVEVMLAKLKAKLLEEIISPE